MKCQICKIKEAKTQISKSIMGFKQTLYLCDDCVKMEGKIWSVINFNLTSLDNPMKSFGNFNPWDVGSCINVDLNNIISGFFNVINNIKSTDEQQETTTIKCELCNTSYEQTIKTGKLGCCNCYEAFRESLFSPLKKIHGNVRHVGKIPKRLGGEIKIKKQIEILQNELKEAVIKEDFENAAIIRDKIKQIKNENCGNF